MSTFDNDLANTKRLLSMLGTDHPKYLDAHTLFKRLEENISNAELYGDTDERSASRTEIRHGLDKISLEIYKCTIDNLDGDVQSSKNKQIFSPPESKYPNPSVAAIKLDGKLIFISHSSKDEAFVTKLAEDLTEAGFKIWHDDKNIKVSQSIPREISKGLNNCRYFLIVLTPDSVESHWVQQEIDAAIMSKKTIIPVLLKDCDRPMLLQANKYADFRTDYQSGMKSLLKGLREAPDKNVNQKTGLSPGLLFIFSIIERAFSKGDFTPEQRDNLKELIVDIAMKKQRGEELMTPVNPDNVGEMFSYSSQLLTYDLVSLSDYHAAWQSMGLGDGQKNNSIVLLHELQRHVMTASALVDQIFKNRTGKKIRSDAEKILDAVRSLKITLADIDKYLYSGKIPFNVTDEIEKYFDDLVYYLSKYIATLNEFTGNSGHKELIQ